MVILGVFRQSVIWKTFIVVDLAALLLFEALMFSCIIREAALDYQFLIYRSDHLKHYCYNYCLLDHPPTEAGITLFDKKLSQ